MKTRMCIIHLLVPFQFVSGLRLKYNSLHYENIESLNPEIRKLTNLTALDLSCNAINLYQSMTVCEVMGEMLACLPKLQRLDLSNNRIKTTLRRILSPVPRPLKYLRLAACGLTCTDVAYFQLSHHIEGIEELDLSENNLAPCVRVLTNSLLAACGTLLTLEMESCSLKDEHVVPLLRGLSALHSLLYLNIAKNDFAKTSAIAVLECVSKLQSSRAVNISYPMECYMIESDSADEISRFKLQTLIDMQKAAHLTRGENKPKLHISIVDLESF